MILADQMRWDMLGATGNKAIKTPNLDYLAENGVLFEKAYSSTPICTPARAILLTGMKPWKNGMLAYGDLATEYKQELPKVLAEELGYFTSVIGKNHFGWNITENKGIPHGYDHMELYDGLEADGDKEYDDYDKWFNETTGISNPMNPGQGWNYWWGKPYEYEEYLHPTAWTGKKTVEFIENYDFKKPLFLKASFHRPHSPYDPP